MNPMNDMKNEVKKTAKKAKFMAKEMVEGAMSIMESKKDDLVDFYDRKKFSHDIKKQMKNEMK